MPEVDKFFQEVRKLTDAVLDELVPSEKIQPSRLYQAIRWSLFGEGKRFRPALVIATGRTLGAVDNMLLRTATGVEMIHTYSLIHDDLPAMDDDDLRRGRATAHKKFDESTAILAGDALQAMAFEAIAGDEKLDGELRLRLVSELAVAASQMVAGQQLDLEAEGQSLDLGSIEKIHAGKTGALIRFAVRAGGFIGSATEEEMSLLTRFSEHLGLLFQITDDILDLTQSTEALGKTARKDVTSQKATYPSLFGVDESRSLARKVHIEAIRSLDPIGSNTLSLREIANYIVSRRS